MKKIKKIVLLLFFAVSVFSITTLKVKLEANYVLDTTTLVADIQDVTNEINEESSFSYEDCQIPRFLEKTFYDDQKRIRFVNIVNELRNNYYSYINYGNKTEYVLAQSFVYVSMLLFQSLKLNLSLELLLVSCEGTIGTYTPYYGYILNDNPVICDCFHNNRTGGNFDLDYHYFNESLDLKLSLRRFNCSVSENNILVTDVYDFETYYDEYNFLFNKILEMFGRLMNAGYIHSFNISYSAKHDTSYTYINHNDSYHTKKCKCGYSIEEKHTWSHYPHNSFTPLYDPNKMICRKCGRTKYSEII